MALTESPLSTPIEAFDNQGNTLPSGFADDSISPLHENFSSHPTSGVVELPPLRKRAITFADAPKESETQLQNGGAGAQGSQETEFRRPISRTTLQMLHPYLTFAPTIRRNSVLPFRSFLTVDVCRPF